MVQANVEAVAVQDLFEDGQKPAQVPKNYIAPADKIPVVPLQPGNSVPVIDLHHFDLSQEQHEQIIKEMAMASFEWGFFQVVNHGIDIELLAHAQEVSKNFFHLPREEKMKYAAKGHSFQQDGYGSRIFTAEDAVQLWRDYILLRMHPIKNMDAWPSNPPEYREAMARLGEGFLLLAKRLLGFLSEGVGLPSAYFEEKFGEPTQSILTNYYPSCPEPDKVLGFMPHSDFGGLTLLLQDTTPGLQVLKDNSWITVEPIPGAITINISDLLELMSNGRYRSVIHRVKVSVTSPRMSIASNYSCALEASVAPAPELIDEEHPQMYKPVVFGDYVAVVAERGPTGKSYMLLQEEKEPSYMLLQEKSRD